MYMKKQRAQHSQDKFGGGGIEVKALTLTSIKICYVSYSD